MKEKFRPIQIIHLSLIAGISIVYFMLGNLQSLDFLELPKITSSSFIYLLIPLGAIIVGHLLFKNQLANVQSKLTPEEKLGPYQTASIIRWALLEGAAFLILFLSPDLILIGLILIVYMAFLRPTLEGMQRDFQSAGK